MLSLNWREIATNPPAEFSQREEFTQPSVLDIDTLVQKVRCLRRATPTQRFDKIQDQCGILQLLDISRPVAFLHFLFDLSGCLASLRLRIFQPTLHLKP
ncbi:MAG: hypothetical protein V7L00_06255 [Nostoc sp.]